MHRRVAQQLLSEQDSPMRTPIVLAVCTLVGSAGLANADVIFQDSFENGLSQWGGKNGGAHHGILVIDPFDSNNTVLSFNQLIAGGDLFTLDAFSLSLDQSYQLSFDYLGLAQERSRAGDTGGYVGFSVDMPGNHSWHWATGSASGSQDVLIDNGRWNSYTFEFTSADIGIGESVRLMLEDFSGSRGVSGDAFFDNIYFAPASIPAPGTAMVIGLGGLLAIRRRR